MGSSVVGGGFSADELEQALTDSDWQMRRMAVELGELSPEQLARALQDDMYDVRRIAEREVSLREARAFAKESVGLDCDAVDVGVDRSYTGKVLRINRFHVVQNLGRGVVAHLKTDLSRIVEEGEMIGIEYSNGKTRVSRRDVEVDRGVGR